MPAFSVPENLAFDSYSDLVTALEQWLDRSDLSGSAQAMIALAEARMRRELAPYFSEASASAVAVNGVAPLPADCGTLTRVMYDGRVLPQMGVTAADTVSRSGSEPQAFTMEMGAVRLWPAGNYTVTLLYHPTLEQLSEANPTNFILGRHPDLYFFGAMLFAEGYLANDERAAVFKALWDEALASAQAYFVRQHFAGPLVARAGFLP